MGEELQPVQETSVQAGFLPIYKIYDVYICINKYIY